MPEPYNMYDVKARNMTAPAGAHGLSREEQRRVWIMRRRRRQRIRRMMLFAFLLFLAASVGIMLSLTVFFKISEITVSGGSKYTAQQIIEACGIKTGANLFTANSEKAKQSIMQKLPYIGSVDIRKRLPSKLEIIIADTAPAAAVSEPGGYTILDAAGKVLEINAGRPEGVPALTGVTFALKEPGKTARFQDEKTLELYMRIISLIKEKKDIRDITGVDLGDPTGLYITYQNRLKLLLGSDSDLDYKFAFIPGAVEDIDKSYPGARGTIDFSKSKKAVFTPERKAS